MSPYEIVYPGGSVEHTNEEPGAVWMQRLLAVYPNTIWLNPQPEAVWDYHESIRITRRADGRAHVPADAGRTRSRNAPVEQGALNPMMSDG